MTITRRHALAATLGFAAASFGSAARAQEGWAGIRAAAAREGKIVWYSVMPQPTMARIAAGFRKAFPDIALETFRATSNEQAARIEQERKAGIEGADVWVTTDIGLLRRLGGEGGLAKPTGPASAAWPGAYLQPGNVVIGGAEPWVLAFNTDTLKTKPASFADALKLEYRGKIGTTEPAAVAWIAFYDWLERSEGADFLTRLKAQNPKLYNGAVPIGQAVGSGEIGIGLFNVPSTLRPLMEQGAPIAMVVPAKGMGIHYGAAALGWSKRPNASLVFLDYLMSAEGQALWHGTGDSASPLRGIAGALDADAIEPFDPAAFPPERVAAFRARWNAVFK